MLFQVIGDQAQYLGMFRILGTTFVKMSLYEAKRVRVRRNLNQKLPNRRLQIDGEHYVY